MVTQITVSMNFQVGFGNLEIPDEVREQLLEMHQLDITLDSGKEEEYPEAFEWLNANIKADDAFNWGYEIKEITI